jgi:class 3 adenylate cyclase
VKSSGNDEPELRRVSVMFADIQGSTAMIQHLDAETAAGLIDPALRIMIDAVERYGGVVSNRGDGIMAIFGAPTIAEDHGLRACLAALAIRDAFAAPKTGAQSETADHNVVKARIGIHVGDVVFRPMRIGANWSQDAVGITVHIAARLEQSSEPGMIVLSEAVAALARGFVHTAPLDPIAVKGVDAPIRRVRLLDSDHTASRWGVRTANGLAGFVGRSSELAVLDRALAVTGSGEGGSGGGGLQLAQIVGAAGLGKSRLLHEFLGGAAARHCHVISLVGDYNRQFMPFHPIAAWLRQVLDIAVHEDRTRADEKLRRGLAQMGEAGADLDLAVLERVLGLGHAAPEIASLDTASLAALRQIDLGATLAALVRATAAERRTILVCEDIDAFDAASREMVISALEHLAAQPVLVVTASRTRTRLASVRTRATRQLALEPLSDEEAADLLANIDRRLADNPALAASILRKAGGNPLFLEEVAPLVALQRDALEAGLDDAALPEIPDRVDMLIADRLARLPRPLRRLIKLCAVIGSDVPVDLAVALTGIPQDALYPQLLKLQSEKLLYETRKFPDPQFSFKHALTRDTAYRATLAATRRKSHARLVEILEAGDEAARMRHLDDLCVHAIQAQLWSRAAPYLHQAASRAAARGAYQLAATYLNRAHEIAGSLLDSDASDTHGTARLRLEILLGRYVLEYFTGDYPRMAALLDEAEPLAMRVGDLKRQTRILALRVHVFNIIGKLDEAVDLGLRARAAARQSGDTSVLLSSTVFLGHSHFNAGRLGEAETILSENVAVIAGLNMEFGAPPDSSDEATGGMNHGTVLIAATASYGTRAMNRGLRGDFAGARADIAEALALSAKTGRPWDGIYVRASGGFVELWARNGEAAKDLFRDALDRSDEAGIGQMKPAAMTGLGHALLLLGDVDAAAEMLTAAERLTQAAHRTMFQIIAACGLTHIHLAREDFGAARSSADAAVAIAERAGFDGMLVLALRAQGQVLAAIQPSHPDARLTIEASLALAERCDMRADIAHAHALLATLGDGAHHMAQAASGYAVLGMDAWWERTERAIRAGALLYL